MFSSCKSLMCACSPSKLLLNGLLNLSNQQIRTATTVVLRRKLPLRLSKKDHTPRKMNHRDFIYEVEEQMGLKPRKPIDIILTQYVEGYGEKGEKISLKPNKAYSEFLLPQLAVYASPENIKKYLIKREDQSKTYSSITVPAMLNHLSRFLLPVTMSIENPWVMEQWHIKTNFRIMGLQVPEYAITLPDKEIAGPNLDNEGKEFYITVTINKTEKVPVRCRLLHSSADVSKQLDLIADRWKIPGKAIFPEDQEFLDSLPRPRYEDKQKNFDD